MTFSAQAIDASAPESLIPSQVGGTMQPKHRLDVNGWIAGAFLVLGMIGMPAMAQPADSAVRAFKSCTQCHDETSKDPVLAITKTRHGVSADGRTPFADQACITCHGASTAHLEDEGETPPLPDVTFKETDAKVGNAVCLTCHQSGARMHWAGSKHDNENVSCSSCHDTHVAHDPVLDKASQPLVCNTCHTQVRADMLKPFRHPIREGKVTCSDCHNTHGSTAPSQLVKNNVVETCYQCHADKRGPFLWEHQPVNDDCGICHKPHGSVTPAMLVTRGPWLCEQCHSAGNHPSAAYSGTGLPGATRPSGAQQVLGKNCMNCHTEVHGSNHPSGPRLTR
jgi:DmsE family decaheme c-type cytochrome